MDSFVKELFKNKRLPNTLSNSISLHVRRFSQEIGANWMHE